MSDAPNFHKLITVSGVITTQDNVILDAIIVGTDDVNDAEITGYDGEADTGTECLPTATQPAEQKGWFGLTKYNCLCRDGIYIKITCVGSVEVVVLWRPAGAQQ